MANQIRIKTSVEVVNDNSVSGENGQDYTHEALDGNVGSRTWGGSYNIATTYTSDKVGHWQGVVVSATAADGIDDSGWTEAAALTAGAVPSIAHVVAVEYASQSIGADSTVTVQIGSEIHALLTPGEGVVIPLSAGEAPANIEVFDANYSNGVREAVVNVMMAGV